DHVLVVRRRLLHPLERLLHARVVAAVAQFRHPLALPLLGRVVDPEDLDVLVARALRERVDADDQPLALLDLALLPLRGRGDLTLEVPVLDAARDAAERLDLLEDLLRLALETVRLRLDVVRA